MLLATSDATAGAGTWGQAAWRGVSIPLPGYLHLLLAPGSCTGDRSVLAANGVSLQELELVMPGSWV